MTKLILKAYDSVIDAIVIGLVLMMLVVLCFAFADVLMELIHMIPSLGNRRFAGEEFRTLVTSVLNILVIIELFSTFISYVKIKRIRLSMLIDVTAVFVLRGMLVQLYAKAFSSEELLVLAGLLVILVVARSITGRFHPNARKVADSPATRED